jgi:hypothetical protein
VIGEVAQSVLVSLLKDWNFVTTHIPTCRSSKVHVNMILYMFIKIHVMWIRHAKL